MKIQILAIVTYCFWGILNAQDVILCGTINPGTGHFDATFETNQGNYYIAQTSLDAKSWTSVGTALLGTGQSATLAFSVTNNRQFYRIIESNTPETEIETVSGLPAADFDTGWISISTNEIKQLTHSMGSIPRLAVMWASQSSDGSNQYLMDSKFVRGSGDVGSFLQSLTNSTFEVRGGFHYPGTVDTQNPIWVRVYLWK